MKNTETGYKNIRIDYYTGTGGSKLVAELLADKLKHENQNIEVNRIYRDNIKKVEKPETDYGKMTYYIYGHRKSGLIFLCCWSSVSAKF